MNYEANMRVMPIKHNINVDRFLELNIRKIIEIKTPYQQSVCHTVYIYRRCILYWSSYIKEYYI